MSRNSIVHLAKGIKFDRGYKNICNYTDAGFLDLVSNTQKVQSFTNLSYIRHDKPLDLEINYDKALQCNYLCFQNTTYSTKWFYAWIDKVEYISDRNVRIHFTIDVWATWSNKITKKPCYVVREHVSNDSVGLHTIEENLSTNNFISEGVSFDPNFVGTDYICIISTYNPDTKKDFNYISVYNKSVYGAQVFLIPYNISGLESLIVFLTCVNADGKLSSIQNIFIVPHALIGDINSEHFETYTCSTGSHTATFYSKHYSFTNEIFETTISDSIGYSVHNNKCKIYPYRYLYVTNNSGSGNIYKWEFFDKENNNVYFRNELALTPGVSGRCVPVGYKGKDLDYDEAIELGKYPNCSWTGDAYINWLTQNAVNIPVQFALNMLGVGVNLTSTQDTSKMSEKQIASSNINTGISSAINVASNVAGLIGQFYSASLLPNKMAGSNNGDVNYAAGSLKFYFYKMRLCDEELKTIDDYFTRFGYKVNVNKIPEFNSRTYWNYVEIAHGEAIGYGEIPAEAMETINNIFRNGVTIWHHHSHLGDFSLHNWL